MEEIRKIKVSRVKPKNDIKKIKVSRVKDVPMDIQDIMRVRVIKFKREYDQFLELTGHAPDEFVEQVVNQIAALWFKYKNGYNAVLVKKELKEIKYLEFMETFMNISFHKMKLMNVASKMVNGAAILYNLLIRLVAEDDKKIKTYCKLGDFYNEFTNKKYCLFGIEHKSSNYDIDYSLGRMFAIRNRQILCYGDEIETCKDLKGAIIYVECDYKKLFMAIPYRYYKKIQEIKSFQLSSYIMIDVGRNHAYDEYESFDEVCQACYEDESRNECKVSDAIYYSEELYATGFIQIVKNVLFFENLNEFMSEWDYITEEGVSVNSPKVTIELKNGELKCMNYYKFISEYFYFLRI